MSADPRHNAVLLSEDSVGVMTESKTRSIDSNGHSYRVSLNPYWLEQLNMGEAGKPTVHSVSLGRCPVVVQKPAIILQSAEALGMVEK